MFSLNNKMNIEKNIDIIKKWFDYNKEKIVFGNKEAIFQLKQWEACLNMLDVLENDNNNDVSFECKFCGNLQFKNSSNDIANNGSEKFYQYCNNCLDNACFCRSCNDILFDNDIHIVDDETYCQNCYFVAMQDIYKNHVIVNEHIKQLLDSKKDIMEAFFLIDNYWYSIEYHARSKCFRLGSFSGNSWFDIGDNKNYLLNAIDYHVGKNIVAVKNER